MDDDPLHLDLMAHELLEHDFQVVTAADGSQAIRLLDRERFDLVFLDLEMPKTDGFGVLAHMQRVFLMVPTVVVSNADRRDHEALCGALGAKEMVAKVNLEEGALWKLAQKHLRPRLLRKRRKKS